MQFFLYKDDLKKRDHMELSARMGQGENGRKGTGIMKHNWQVQNRRGGVKKVQEMEIPKNLYAQSWT